MPGDREKKCIVRLMGDTLFEREENFKLVLGSPKSEVEGNRYVDGWFASSEGNAN